MDTEMATARKLSFIARNREGGEKRENEEVGGEGQEKVNVGWSTRKEKCSSAFQACDEIGTEARDQEEMLRGSRLTGQALRRLVPGAIRPNVVSTTAIATS